MVKNTGELIKSDSVQQSTIQEGSCTHMYRGAWIEYLSPTIVYEFYTMLEKYGQPN